jgi:signal transduction histidine kinase
MPPVMPQLRLDDLLTELQGRINEILATRDRVHTLLEAIVSIGSDLELDAMLRRIVEAAITLVDARYGALGVVGEGERLDQFITTGVSQEEIDAIGHWPHGLGILGLLIKDPRPIRLADLSTRPESYGFPANHPPMRRFLGVPIRVREEIFGNLYLTEKAGGAEFDDEDEKVVLALATAAAVAIENARLYQEARGRERWLQASAEVSTALLSGTDPADVLDLVVRRAREICDADLATVSLADGPGGDLVVRASDARDVGLLDRVPFDQSIADEVFTSGSSQTVAQVDEAAPSEPGVRLGTVLSVPLGAGAAAHGVLSVTNIADHVLLGESMRRLLEAFAAQAAIALELAERRRDAERLVVLEDRDRIAKDLHDTVIQRLFATAMTLMSAIKITQKPDVAARVQRAVDDLDDTIRQIRSTIFALQAPPGEPPRLRSRLHDVIDGVTENLGFAPAVRLDGPIDLTVDDTTGETLLAVVQEALSNVVRHAHAARVEVSIVAGPDLRLQVTDNGVGIPGEPNRRSGLANLTARAERLGGTFHVSAREGGGTMLDWRVPLHRKER